MTADKKRVLRFEHPRHKRRAIRTEDLDDATIAAIMAAEPGERSQALNHLMDDDGDAG